MNKDVVRTGYDAIAAAYLADKCEDPNQLALLTDLAARVPSGASVLDVGCGAGIPVTRWLSERFTVAGVDISAEQIRLARQFVPNARFLCADITAIDLPPETFDAICSFYAAIHIPREEHRPLLQRFHRWLKPGGALLIWMGAGDCLGAVEEFYAAPMYWSHYDAETNRRLTEEAGFSIIRAEFVPDNLDPELAANHLFILAEKAETLP